MSDPRTGDLFGGTAAPASEPPVRRARETAPLADRLRPTSLGEIVGQKKALDTDGPLGRMLARKRLGSVILWGPPGCGKTTLARLLSDAVGVPLLPLSAVMSGVADVRKAFELARAHQLNGVTPILFIDEIHRFNRAQQDALLKEVEEGTVTLVGATTENPSFALNAALLSRCYTVVLERLEDDALLDLAARAESLLGKALPLDEAGRMQLARLADGDGRYFLTMIDTLSDLPSKPVLDAAALAQALERRLPVYDRAQEAHYNLISALHKSVRGSDPDAALYWLSRMLEGGEDPRFLARRLVRMASEDIGLADPDALTRAIAAAEAYERLGSPEGELMLAQITVDLALAPKSNALYKAFGAARRAAAQNGSLMPPTHILNAPTGLMKKLGYGAGYLYDHDAPDRFSAQNYFPDAMARERYYQPGEQGFESRLKARIDQLERWRKAREGEGEGDGERGDGE